MSSVLSFATSASTLLGTVFAGISWEPEIRGVLTVAVAVAVLMGSIWLLLVTNSGVRLGSMLALAGIFGWMFLMGIIWWIYGIGWVGSSPTWEVKEFVTDPAGIEEPSIGIAEAVTGRVADLPDTNCGLDVDVFNSATASSAALSGYQYAGPQPGCTPRAVELLLAFDGPEREAVLQELLNPQNNENKIEAISETVSGADNIFEALLVRSQSEITEVVSARNATITGADDPRRLSDSQIEDVVAARVATRNQRIDELTLSALDAIGPAIIEDAEERGWLNLNQWNLLSTAESGEATATADAALRENEIFGADAEFIFLDAFQQGGKPGRTSDSIGARVWHKIASTARITHPTNYAVVQAQVAVDQPAVPGEAPPLPTVDTEKANVSVVMERNLGNLRLIPALFTFVNLAIFLACCLVLHLRDLTLRERLAGGAAAAV